ncbi:MAG TPA: GH32 C-terminal domain-containing protein, partial [bacterium]|nr:GH32 C-terminal domain-containing protein [bacterium]
KGSAFGNRPARGALAQQNHVNGYKGQRLVNSFYNGDQSTGVASSPEFTIKKDFISFLIGGGNYPGKTCLNLQVNDSIIYSATGNNSEFLEWKNWNVENYEGQKARLNIIDNCQDNWGHINVDHIIFSDKPVQAAKYPPHWVDYGKDFYAAISYANIPESDGRRIWIGWMNNWLYTQEIPTSPWRSAQSLPRKLSLQSIDGRLRLIQQPVGELQKLRGKHYSFSNTSIKKVNNQLANRNIKGQCLEIRLTAHMTGKEKAGIKVRKGANQETIIGYNGRKKEVFLNRKNSGQSDFHDNFAEKHSAPLPLSKNILVLHIFVDRSSVEVFANNGQIVITDRIFPDFASDQIELFGDFGNGLPIQSLDIWKLKSIWQAKN